MIDMPSAIGAGKVRRASRIIKPDGRAVLVAIDMQGSSGAGPDLDAVEKVVAGGADGVLASWQIARKYPEAFAATGLVLRIDGALTQLGSYAQGDVFTLMYQVEQALKIGADAVVLMAFPGAEDEELSLRRLAKLVGECEMVGLPIIAESVPGNFTKQIPHTTENIARCARICVEIGADMIKTPAPENVAELEQVVAVCEAPLFVLGGPKKDTEDEAIEYAASVVEAGASGVAFGRNAWGASDVTGFVTRLTGAVHGA
jgi:DhnA family fructose-bisphosphate aldolase class Ia